MTKIKIVMSAVLLAAAGGAFAQSTTDTTRDQRMDQALQDYRAKNGTSSGSMNSGSMRSGSMSGTDTYRGDRPSKDKSFGQNMKAAGSQMAEGGREVGHDVAQGARKAGHAVHKGASKVGAKAKDMTTNKPAP